MSLPRSSSYCRLVTLDDIKARCEVQGKCWIWTAGVGSHGRPEVRAKGKVQLVANYVFFDLMGNKRQKGHVVSTRCRQALCVSEDCLLQRTRSAVLRESHRTGVRNAADAARQRNPGESNLAKLDWQKVGQIRARGPSDLEALEAEFGVCRKTLQNVLRGMTWRVKTNSVFTWRG